MTTLATEPKKSKRTHANRCAKSEHRAREAIDRHSHFRGRVDNFEFEFREGMLTVRGRVPSFYLREILEKALLRLEGVKRVDNQVDVACSHGLSSVRKKCDSMEA